MEPPTPTFFKVKPAWASTFKLAGSPISPSGPPFFCLNWPRVHGLTQSHGGGHVQFANVGGKRSGSPDRSCGGLWCCPCHLPDACDLDMPSGQADAPFSSDLCPGVLPSVLRAPWGRADDIQWYSPGKTHWTASWSRVTKSPLSVFRLGWQGS